MKYFVITLTVAAFGFAAVPASANSWQWQLDQIKADQQRRARCHAVEQARLLQEKMQEAAKKAELPAPTPPAK